MYRAAWHVGRWIIHDGSLTVMQAANHRSVRVRFGYALMCGIGPVTLARRARRRSAERLAARLGVEVREDDFK